MVATCKHNKCQTPTIVITMIFVLICIVTHLYTELSRINLSIRTLTTQYTAYIESEIFFDGFTQGLMDIATWKGYCYVLPKTKRQKRGCVR